MQTVMLRNSRHAIWRAFFANVGSPGFCKAKLNLKLRLINRACRPLLAFTCSRWPPTHTQLVAVDRLQARLVACAMRTKKLPTESPGEFCRRRNHSAARSAKTMGKWSKMWCSRVVDWDAHIRRGHCTQQWSTNQRLAGHPPSPQQWR